ncbi:MAG: hypothetical protein IH614_07300 [Desulfuromonadales bacterium]|nr:hypothetical protein [Desulfuromonadales bacterium]
MKQLTLLLTLMFALSLPVGAFAMSHGGSGHDHGSKASKKSATDAHGTQGAHDQMVLVGVATVDGVKGEAHLNDVEAAMKRAGMEATHHLMIMFMDVKSGKPITEGRVAAKVTLPDGTSGDPVRLIGMDGHFGADIPLKQKGEYTFEVGTRLPDDKTRQFTFKHQLQ